MILVPRRLLIEGLRDVLIPETLDVVFEENNGALVLVAGPLNIQDSLKDDYYGISMAAVKMRKVVQVGDGESGTLGDRQHLSKTMREIQENWSFFQKCSGDTLVLILG